MSTIEVPDGMPLGSPLVFNDTDIDLESYATGRFAQIAGNNLSALNIQVEALKARIKDIENLTDGQSLFASGNYVPLVTDSNGKVLLTSVDDIKALVGADYKKLSSADATALIGFYNTINSSNNTNLDLTGPLYSLTTYSVAGVTKTVNSQIYPAKSSSLASTPDQAIPFQVGVGDVVDMSTYDSTSNPRYLVVTSKSPLTTAAVDSLQKFKIPSTISELVYWMGQTSGDAAVSASARLATDKITGYTPDAVVWNGITPTTLLGYPPVKVTTSQLSNNQSTLPINTLLQDESGNFHVKSNGTLFDNITVSNPILLFPTKDQVSGFRSQYAELIVQASQRSSEQQTFVNELTQKSAYLDEAASNIFKQFNDAKKSIIR